MKMVPMILILLILFIEMLSVAGYFNLEFLISSKIDLYMSANMSFYSVIFVVMVSMVSTFIMFYSSLYMESYNKKKYLILTMMFFASMVILSLSEGVTSTMMGWDGLGISSICLIMIYQSKKTSSNSILTMAFNRLGDVFLIVGLILVSSNMCDFSFTLDSYGNKSAIVFLMLASMTKSAQFPLSTWLPAAMSAPTPISAMVHSSTLVTAGVYVMIKAHKVLESMKMSWILSMISVTSMIAAGVMTTFEKDLKKIIAFSTMSHISIMMFMISFSMKKLALMHMIAHAIFKTSIFMSAGNKFISVWSDQYLNVTNMSNKTMKKFFMLSALMLTSLPFTVSFYTKDVILEVCMDFSESTVVYTIMLWIVTILTILYSKKIMKTMSESHFMMKTANFKKGLSAMFMTLSFLSMTMSKLTTNMMMNLMSPVIAKSEMLMIILMMVVSFNLNLKKSKVLMFVSTGMMGKTEFTVSKMKLVSEFYNKVSKLDFVMMNSLNWSYKSSKSNKFNSSLKYLAVVVSLVFLLTL